MKNKISLVQKTVRNALFQSLSGIIAKIGGLIFTIVIARILFPELFGLYSIVLSLILTIVAVSDLGLSQTMVRYVAESLGIKNKRKAWKQARSRFLFLLKFKFFISLAVSILLFLLAGLIAGLFKKPELTLPLQVGSIYLFVVSLYGLINQIFLSLQKLKYSTIAESIFQFSRIVLIFVFLYFYKNVTSVFIVLAISVFFALIFSIFLLRKRFKFLFKGKREPVEKKRLLTFSGFLMLSSLNIIVFANIDKLMLGYFLEAKFIGFYAVIVAIISGVLGLMSFGGVVFPVFAQLKGERLRNAFRNSFHYISIVVFPTTIGLAYVFLPALRIFYGGAYVPPGYKITLIITSVLLSFLILERILSGLYAIMFNAKEKPKIPAVTILVVSILNIIFNFIFIYFLIQIKPEYGLIGAASATFLSRYIYFFTLIILGKKRLKILPRKKSILKPIFASLVMLVFLFVFDYFVPLTILWGILMIICAIIVYIGFMFLIKGLTKKDLSILIKSFKSIK